MKFNIAPEFHQKAISSRIKINDPVFTQFWAKVIKIILDVETRYPANYTLGWHSNFIYIKYIENLIIKYS